MASWARWASCAPLLGLLACSFQSSAQSSSSDSSGGCGGSGGGAFSNVVSGAPDKPDRPTAPDGPAPTGTQWKAVATDEGCGRTGLTWVLVDEVCGDGEGVDDDALALYAPMFRDGAKIGDTLFTVDATHLWAIDATSSAALRREALVAGVGQPIAARARGSELVLASLLEGLVFVDGSSAAAPTRTGSLALPGPAFDVDLDGSRAFVAMGRAGLGVVQLDGARALERSVPIPGFAAGVKARGDYAYVAACTTFSVVDLRSGAVVGSTWLPNAVQNKRLVAPAKDVEIVGSTAYVAAGRYGAVAVDVSNPAAPKIRGNCTRLEDGYYASGVRAQGSAVYVAGGEWGVDTFTDGNSSCGSTVDPPAPPPPDTGCAGKPPWEVLPWESLWAPPPPGKDPVQVLPVGDALYAFGDARRIGTRAVDVRGLDVAGLPRRGRYDEPRALLGVAAAGDRVVAVGPGGGVYRDGGASLTREPSVHDATIAAATAATFLPDGRWVVLSAKEELVVEGVASPIPAPGALGLAAFGGTKLAVPTKTTVDLVDVVTKAVQHRALPKPARLPLSVAAKDGVAVVAAPEWTSASRVDGGPTGLPVHGVFDEEDALDTTQWRARLPRRQLAISQRGPVEVAVLGGKAGIAVHATTGTERAAMPALTYGAIATSGDRAYVLGIDRALYRSYLVTVSLAKGAVRVVSVEAFTGAGAGLAQAGSRLYLADADGEIRVYRTDTVGAPSLVSTLRTEARP